MVHDFKESLEFSHKADELPFWESCYRKAFPTMQTMVNHREDGDHQRQGIDRSVILSNGKQLWIDEKVRKKDYGDILLEYVSNDRTNAPGWVCKPLLSDYIAYAIIPSGRCYLLPVPQLQTAWRENRTVWMKTCKKKHAQNASYKTLNLAVPVKTLFPAIGNCLRIQI